MLTLCMRLEAWQQLKYVHLQVPEVKVNAKAMLPSTSVIGFTLNRGLSFITFVNTVPISATRTVNRFALIRRLDVDRIGSHVFNMPLWDTFARQAMIKYAPYLSLYLSTLCFQWNKRLRYSWQIVLKSALRKG